MPEVKIERVSYGGWPNCYRLTNGEIEVVATSDVGPRIIRCGFLGEQNVFAEFPEQLGKSGESSWMPRGGHRLWIAPEVVPDTYALDNHPVQSVTQDTILTIRQAPEPETDLCKEISIELSGEGMVTVTHRVENTGPKPREFAPWAITQMRMGGLAVVAFPPRGTREQQLLPTNPIVMWAYTNFSDPRWRFTSKYLTLSGSTQSPGPQKTGLFNQDTVAAYLLGTDLFVKHTEANPHATYPDFQCSVELFVNDQFLELETLAPLAHVVPGTSVTHVEHWSLHRSVTLEAITDEQIDAVLLPRITWHAPTR